MALNTKNVYFRSVFLTLKQSENLEFCVCLINFCHIDDLFLQARWARCSVACRVISQLVLHTFLKTTWVSLTAFFFKIYSKPYILRKYQIPNCHWSSTISKGTNKIQCLANVFIPLHFFFTFYVAALLVFFFYISLHSIHYIDKAKTESSQLKLITNKINYNIM